MTEIVEYKGEVNNSDLKQSLDSLVEKISGSDSVIEKKIHTIIESMDFSDFEEKDDSTKRVIALLNGLPEKISDIPSVLEQLTILKQYLRDRKIVKDASTESRDEMKIEGELGIKKLVSALKAKDNYNSYIKKLDSFDFSDLSSARKKQVTKLVAELRDETNSNIGPVSSDFKEKWKELTNLLNPKVNLQKYVIEIQGKGRRYAKFAERISWINVEELSKNKRTELITALDDMSKVSPDDFASFMLVWESIQSIIRPLSDEVSSGSSSENASKSPEETIGKEYDDLLDGKIKLDDWNEIDKKIYSLLAEKGELTEKEKLEVQKFLKNVSTHAEKTGKAIKGVGAILDDASSQIDQHTSGPLKVVFNRQGISRKYFNEFLSIAGAKGLHHIGIHGNSVKSGGEFALEFSSKEEAYTVLEGFYEILEDAENFSLIGSTEDWIIDLVASGGLSAISAYNDIVFNGLDIYLSGYVFPGQEGWILGNIMYAGLTGVGWIALNRFLKQLDTGIPPEKFAELTDSIRENIKIYEEAGRTEDAANLKKLANELQNTYKQTIEGGIDSLKNSRQVYMLLQSFRGNSLVDFGRYTTAHVGNFFDGTTGALDAGANDLNRERGFFSAFVAEAKNLSNPKHAMRNIFNLYKLPGMFFVKAVNKGPDGGIGGWNFQSKGAVVLNYLDRFKANKDKFEILYGVIDSIEGLDEKEKTEVKGLILDEYSSPIGKHDILKKWKFDFSGMKIDDFKGLKEIISDGLISKGMPGLSEDAGKREVLSGLKKLFPGATFNVLMKYMQQFNIAKPKKVDLNQESARVLTEYLNKKGILSGSSLNTRIVDRLGQSNEKRENIDKDIHKAKEIFKSIIEFHPQISGDVESKLLVDLNLGSLLASDVDDFKKHVIGQIGINELTNYDDYEKLSKEFIDDSTTVTGKTRSDLMDRFEKTISGKFPDDIIAERMDVMRTLFSENKTFYTPHLSLLLDGIIDHGTILEIDMSDVNQFIGSGHSGGYRDNVLSFLTAKAERIQELPTDLNTENALSQAESEAKAKLERTRSALSVDINTMLGKAERMSELNENGAQTQQLLQLRQMIDQEIAGDNFSIDLDYYKGLILSVTLEDDIPSTDDIKGRLDEVKLREADTLKLEGLRHESHEYFKGIEDRIEKLDALGDHQGIMDKYTQTRVAIEAKIGKEGSAYTDIDSIKKKVLGDLGLPQIPSMAKLEDMEVAKISELYKNLIRYAKIEGDDELLDFLKDGQKQAARNAIDEDFNLRNQIRGLKIRTGLNEIPTSDELDDLEEQKAKEAETKKLEIEKLINERKKLSELIERAEKEARLKYTGGDLAEKLNELDQFKSSIYHDISNFEEIKKKHDDLDKYVRELVGVDQIRNIADLEEAGRTKVAEADAIVHVDGSSDIEKKSVITEVETGDVEGSDKLSSAEKVNAYIDLYDRAIMEAELMGNMQYAEKLIELKNEESMKYMDIVMSGKGEVDIDIDVKKAELEGILGTDIRGFQALDTNFKALQKLVDDGLIEIRDGMYQYVPGKSESDMPKSTKLRTNMIKYIGKAIKTGG